MVSSISIHAPRRGSDLPDHPSAPRSGDFNPRSPQGERPHTFQYVIVYKLFQSTLPAGGATQIPAGNRHRCCKFQSTLPAGGATIMPRVFSASSYFNPRSPQGERQTVRFRRAFAIEFQSTLPAGGATTMRLKWCIISEFQSTLPAGGAT